MKTTIRDRTVNPVPQAPEEETPSAASLLTKRSLPALAVDVRPEAGDTFTRHARTTPKDSS